MSKSDTAMTIYRVTFEGEDLPEDVSTLLEPDVAYESSACDPEGHCRHTVRTRAPSRAQAVERVADAMREYGRYDGYRATELIDPHGNPLTGALDPRWEDIDWSTPERAQLTDLKRAVLGALLDDHEPPWIIPEDADMDAERPKGRTFRCTISLARLRVWSWTAPSTPCSAC
jgi:hypothetical protein